MVRYSFGSECSLKHVYFFQFQILFPLASHVWYAYKCLMPSDIEQNSAFLISYFNHLDIIFSEFRKLDRIFSTFLSKILPLLVVPLFPLSLLRNIYHLHRLINLLCSSALFTKVTSSLYGKKKQNLHQALDLRLSPFQVCKIISRYCSLLNNFLIPHLSQMQKMCQCFSSYWFKLKYRISHDWEEKPLNGSY